MYVKFRIWSQKILVLLVILLFILTYNLCYLQTVMQEILEIKGFVLGPVGMIAWFLEGKLAVMQP